MPYLIDGHNLIPKLGLRLDSVDDEMELVAILQEFARLERSQIEVYFDGAPSISDESGCPTRHPGKGQSSSGSRVLQTIRQPYRQGPSHLDRTDNEQDQCLFLR